MLKKSSIPALIVFFLVPQVFSHSDISMQQVITVNMVNEFCIYLNGCSQGNLKTWFGNQISFRPVG